MDQRFAYGAGGFASITTGYGIDNLANYVVNIALGVNPALLGIAQSIPRLVDLFTEGYLSDTYWHRLGRRTFIAVGSFVSAAFFASVCLFSLGFSVSNGVDQGHATILAMRFVDFSFRTITILLSIWLIACYPLTENEMRRVREALDARSEGHLKENAKVCVPSIPGFLVTAETGGAS